MFTKTSVVFLLAVLSLGYCLLASALNKAITFKNNDPTEIITVDITPPRSLQISPPEKRFTIPPRGGSKIVTFTSDRDTGNPIIQMFTDRLAPITLLCYYILEDNGRLDLSSYKSSTECAVSNQNGNATIKRR